MSLLSKFLDLLKSKPDEGSIPDVGLDAPDTDENTQREMQDKTEESEKSCTLLKIKF